MLSIAALAVLARSVDLEATARQLARADPLPLLLASGLVLVQLVVVTLRWSLLLPRAPEGRIAWPRLVRPVALGYLGNFVLPARLGELVRAAYVSGRWRIGLAPTIGSVLLERVVDTAVLAALAIVLAIALDAPAWMVQVAVVVAIAAIVLVAVLASGIGRPLAQRLAARGGRWTAAIGRALLGFFVGASPDRRFAIVPAALLSAVSWTIEGTVYFLVAASLGLEVSLPGALLVAAVTVLATAIPAGPAYVGTFELATTAAATALGVPAAAGLAWGVVAHVITVVPLMTAGLVALVTTESGFGDMVRAAREAEDELERPATLP